MTESNASAQWDIFVSYARADAAEVRLLVDALKAQHLRVFVDEQSVEVHESITQRISQGLANSAAMLVYYSRLYPTRSACQRELTAAFLSAQASGEIARRTRIGSVRCMDSAWPRSGSRTFRPARTWPSGPSRGSGGC